MKNLIFVLAFLALSINIFSQQKITVQNGNSATFYNDLATAVNEAPAGSTIYIPGGIFPIGTINILKPLNIYGVGHYPDPILNEKGRTILSGDIHLGGSYSNIHLEGFYLNGSIAAYDCGDIDNIVIKRINMGNLSLGCGNQNSYWSNILISENIIRGSIYNSYAYNVTYLKNIIGASVNNINNNKGQINFKNNVFLKQTNMIWIDYGWSNRICTNDLLLSYVYNALFENNIFVFNINCWHNDCAYGGCDPYNYSLSNSCYYNNNIFLVPFEKSPLSLSYNYGQNNKFNYSLQEIFENVSSYSFEYSFSYLLKLTEGKNAGTDGTDIGIFGTSYPYKENAIPETPHIKSSSVSSQTTNGKIQVNVQVEAQSK